MSDIYYYALKMSTRSYSRFSKAVDDFRTKLGNDEGPEAPGYRYVFFGLDLKIENPEELLPNLAEYPEYPKEFPLETLDDGELERLVDAAKIPEKPISGGIWIPYKFIDDHMDLPPPERAVEAILSSHRNSVTGLAAPGLALLVSRTKLSQSTVNRALKKLQERKRIKYHGGGNGVDNPTQWHLLGQGSNGPCKNCAIRKKTGGAPKGNQNAKKKTPKVVI